MCIPKIIWSDPIPSHPLPSRPVPSPPSIHLSVLPDCYLLHLEIGNAFPQMAIEWEIYNDPSKSSNLGGALFPNKPRSSWEIWPSCCIWDHVDLVKQLISHEIQQILLRHAAVPVIHNVPTIHDLAKDVSQVIPWNLHSWRSLQVVVQDLGWVPQITGWEWIPEHKLEMKKWSWKPKYAKFTRITVNRPLQCITTKQCHAQQRVASCCSPWVQTSFAPT